jgi:uncharacterized membrane protein
MPILFLVGGVVYFLIELIWRGHSHWTMAIVGGVAFVLIGEINERFSWLMPLSKQCLIATFIITMLEFVTGCIVNLLLHWNVWHYTVLSILGQISLPFMILWYFLSVVAIILDDIIRWKLFNEEKPQYTIF